MKGHFDTAEVVVSIIRIRMYPHDNVVHAQIRATDLAHIQNYR
jgi:hypothetical protein